MSEPNRPVSEPHAIEVVAGKRYWWCSCGRSQRQPFCDGSHAGSGLEPVEIVAERDQRLWFCGCKRSARAPLCDGSHARMNAS